MKTEALIDLLVTDAPAVGRLPSAALRCTRWLSCALAFVAGSVALAGFRPDLAARSHDGGFLLESASLLLVIVLAARSAFALSVPDDDRERATFWLPLLAFLFWLALVLLRARSGAASAELEAGSGLPCALRITCLAALPALVCGVMLRRAAPQQLGWTGSLLSLSAFSLAALGAQVLCAHDGARHVLEWHCLPVLLGGLAGGCLGAVALRRRRDRHSRRPL